MTQTPVCHQTDFSGSCTHACTYARTHTHTHVSVQSKQQESQQGGGAEALVAARLRIERHQPPTTHTNAKLKPTSASATGAHSYLAAVADVTVSVIKRKSRKSRFYICRPLVLFILRALRVFISSSSHHFSWQKRHYSDLES